MLNVNGHYFYENVTLYTVQCTLLATLNTLTRDSFGKLVQHVESVDLSTSYYVEYPINLVQNIYFVEGR